LYNICKDAKKQLTQDSCSSFQVPWIYPLPSLLCDIFVPDIFPSWEGTSIYYNWTEKLLRQKWSHQYVIQGSYLFLAKQSACYNPQQMYVEHLDKCSLSHPCFTYLKQFGFNLTKMARPLPSPKMMLIHKKKKHCRWKTTYLWRGRGFSKVSHHFGQRL